MRSLEYYLDGHYAEEILTENGPGETKIVSARLAGLPGCVAQGTSESEALSSLRAIRDAYITALYEAGVPLPEPDNPKVTIASFSMTGGISHAVASPSHHRQLNPHMSLA